MGPVTPAAVGAAIDRVTGAVGPWESGQGYLNFKERATDSGSFYADVAYRRLKKVKAEYDSAGIFQANHTIAS